jgi:hypothetical protein
MTLTMTMKMLLLLLANVPLFTQASDDSYFYLKMANYKSWCIQCEFHTRQNGPACQVGDSLVLDDCYTGSPRQRFYYEEVTNGKGRFKPLGSPGLCFTLYEMSELYLDYCEDDNEDQIFSGFDPEVEFRIESSSEWGLDFCLGSNGSDLIANTRCSDDDTLLWEASDVELACPKVCLELTQGGKTFEVLPITTPQTLEEFYDYNGNGDYSFNGIEFVPTVADHTLIFIHHEEGDCGKLGVVVINDSIEDCTGGRVNLDISGNHQDAVVQDGPNSIYGGPSDTYEYIDDGDYTEMEWNWSWQSGCKYRSDGIADYWDTDARDRCMFVDPVRFDGIVKWQFVSGPAPADPDDYITLDMDERIWICWVDC